MSYDHIRAVAQRFNGTLAQRMILTAFAVHVNPTTGYSTLSIIGVARFTRLQPSYVRRLVRALEGGVDALQPEPGKWLYPLNKQSRPGDGQATCYRMFLDAYTAPAKRRAATNPTGLKRTGVGVQEPGFQEPTRRAPGTHPHPGLQEPTGGFQQSATWVPGTPKPGFQEPTKAIESSKSPEAHPRPGDVLKALAAAARQSRPTGTPLAVGQSGASPQTPKQPAGDGDPIGIADRSPAPPEAAFDDDAELALIADHQPPLDPIP